MGDIPFDQQSTPIRITNSDETYTVDVEHELDGKNGILAKARLCDAIGNKILSEAGSLLVKSTVVVPDQAIPVQFEVRGSVAGSSVSDLPYIIPNNATIKLQKIIGGIYPNTTNSSSIELYYDASGSISATAYRISLGYVMSSMFVDDLNKSYAGNGTRAVIARRARLDATAREMYIRVLGYLEYKTITEHATRVSTAITASLLTDSTRTWTINEHVGRYLMIKENTPLKITANTATTLTIANNIQLVVGDPYKIITFNP